jgi:predicted metal-dependent hydrolase
LPDLGPGARPAPAGGPPAAGPDPEDAGWRPDLPPGDPERFRDSPGLLHGVELFNAGEFWEAHEAWEGVWMPYRREAGADFFKGLIQIAAGCHHHRRRNRNGALIKWRSGVDHLRPWLPEAHGLLLQTLVDQIEACREALELADWAELRMPRISLA